MTETGGLSNTTTATGNSVIGSYNRTITVADSYTMTETGTNSGNSFTETVTGYETPTLTESGNPATDTFSRTITGSGTYNRTDTGPGASLSNVTGGTDSYTLTEAGDSLGAVFSQTLTETDRYSLLEHFVDVSNTGNGNTPGNMNFCAFGQPFVDPFTQPKDEGFRPLAGWYRLPDYGGRMMQTQPSKWTFEFKIPESVRGVVPGPFDQLSRELKAWGFHSQLEMARGDKSKNSKLKTTQWGQVDLFIAVPKLVDWIRGKK